VGLVGCFGCLPFIAIFAAILFPVFYAARQSARETNSMSNLKIIGLASIQYENDHFNKYPPTDTMAHFKAALKPYMTTEDNEDLFTEPGTGKPYALNANLSNQDVASQGNPADFVLARETIPLRNGMIATLYADGHVARIGQSSDNSTPGGNPGPM
jgi:prepilin-type processing-associated H-X9-DG protein